MFAAGAAAAAASIRAEQGPGPHQRESGTRRRGPGPRTRAERGEAARRGGRERCPGAREPEQPRRSTTGAATGARRTTTGGPLWPAVEGGRPGQEAQAEDRRRIPPSSQAPHEPRGRRPQERKGTAEAKGSPEAAPCGSYRHGRDRRRSNSPGEDVSYPPRDQRQPCPDDRACFNYGKTGHLARDCPSAPAEGEAVCSLPCNAQSTGDNSTTGSSQLCSGLPLSSPLCFVPSPPPTPTLLPYPTGLLQTVTDE